MTEAEAKRRAEEAYNQAQIGEYWGEREDIVKFVAAAILSAYREGLERAAQIVEKETMICSCGCVFIADTIRAEKGE